MSPASKAKKELEILANPPAFNKFGFAAHLDRSNISLRTLEEGFRDLLLGADTVVRICSPFMDYRGIRRFIPLLKAKMESGVEVRLLSREIAPGESGRRRADAKRISAELARSRPELIQIRSYHFGKGKKVVSSSHAKILIADEEVAYLGSGEMRENSFSKLLELGVLLRDPHTVRAVTSLFDYMFEVAEPFSATEVG